MNLNGNRRKRKDKRKLKLVKGVKYKQNGHTKKKQKG
jgi:hypothetical protein